MKDDLSFKQNEMEKSEATASGLAGGRHRHHLCVQYNQYNAMFILFYIIIGYLFTDGNGIGSV